jgi:hypothetical protein
MALPIFNTDNQSLGLLQTSWASQLNPVIANPVSSGRLIKSVVLASGANIVSHGLGRKLQGWVIVRQRASATFYDTQDSNGKPELTLLLTASGAVTVDLFVF